MRKVLGRGSKESKESHSLTGHSETKLRNDSLMCGWIVHKSKEEETERVNNAARLLVCTMDGLHLLKGNTQVRLVAAI